MVKWEYKIVWLNRAEVSETDQLCLFGLQGWELVAADFFDRVVPQYILKRPLPQEADAAYVAALCGEFKEANQ